MYAPILISNHSLPLQSSEEDYFHCSHMIPVYLSTNIYSAKPILLETMKFVISITSVIGTSFLYSNLNWDTLFSSLVHLMLFTLCSPLGLCWLSGGHLENFPMNRENGLQIFFILNCYWTLTWFPLRRKGPSWLLCSNIQWSGSEYKWLLNPCKGIMLSLFNTPWEEDMRTGWNSELV